MSKRPEMVASRCTRPHVSNGDTLGVGVSPLLKRGPFACGHFLNIWEVMRKN